MTTKVKNTDEKTAGTDIKKKRALRKVRTLDDRIAVLEGKVKSHREIADKFEVKLNQLLDKKRVVEEKKARETQMQQALLEKTPEELEAELAEAEEAAKKAAAIRAALKDKKAVESVVES